MSIHKTSSGTYRVRWREHYKMKSRTFRRKVDAQKFEAKVQLGQQEDTRQLGEKTTFKEMTEIWLDDYALVHKAPSTVIRDKQMLRDYIFPLVGEKYLSDLQHRDFAMMQSKLINKDNLSPKTVNNTLSLARKILEDATTWGYLTLNPAKTVQRIKIPDRDYRFWSFHDRDAFLTLSKEKDHELHEIISFAIHTGLRRGEVEGLLWDCVDLDQKIITVKRNFCHKTKKLNSYTKGKNIRRVPLNSFLVELLSNKERTSNSHSVFHANFSKIVSRRFKPLQKQAGVTIITFHDLRHSFASHLAMSGVSMFDIQQLLGHSDVKTTMRYMHLAPDHLSGTTDILMRERP